MGLNWASYGSLLTQFEYATRWPQADKDEQRAYLVVDTDGLSVYGVSEQRLLLKHKPQD